MNLPDWLKNMIGVYEDYGYLQVQGNAGRFAGMNISFTLSKNGLSSYVGLGAGFGTSITGTAGMKTGETSGWAVRSTVTAKLRGPVAAKHSYTISQGGNSNAVGLGVASGSSWTVTGGYNAKLMEFDGDTFFSKLSDFVESYECEEKCE